MKKEDAQFLIQLGDSLKDAGMRLEAAYRNKNYDEFSKLKKFILDIQKKIKEVSA